VARIPYLGLLAIGACARAGTGEPDVVVDAGQDATPCAIQTYYKDADGDGHGNPVMAVQACTAPAGTVASNDDCDDNHPQRFPGNAELCDVIDNDCNAVTMEMASCPTGCTPIRRPAPDDVAHSYLFCTATATWASAAATCGNAMYKMVQIENAAENAFVRSTANLVFPVGVVIYIGANDIATEGVWAWDGSVQFWQGGPIGGGGGPFMSRYANWDPDEPNNSSNAEDVAEMKSDGTWNDAGGGTLLRFACRR